MKILVTMSLTAAQLDRVRAAAGDATVVMTQDPDDQRREIQDAQVLFGRPTPELFEFAPALEWIQQHAAGAELSLFPALVESDTILTSEKGQVGIHVADHIFALLLALTRGVAHSIRAGSWEAAKPQALRPWELADSTMGIVGLGGAGREVVRRALGFGMRVLAVDPEDVPLPAGVEACWKLDRFHRLLSESDVVAICAPLTEQTHGMFDRAAFHAMRRHALLVNAGRGEIVAEEALLKALNDGLIGGAGLDVTPVEPLPDDHPLWTMPNVVITPHIAGSSPARFGRLVDLFCRNLLRFRAGEPLESVIDKRKGY